MIKKLGEIAEIQFGPYEKGSEVGKAKYLLASHFDEFYKPTKFEQSFVDLTSSNEKGVLQFNDVIVAGKGQRTFAWAYNQQEGICIPSSLFFILHTKKEFILGKYLAYYLNSEKVQKKMKLIGSVGTVPSIPKNELKQLKIVIPTIEEQQKIIDIAEVLEQNVSLTKEILSKKKAMKKTIMNKLLNTE